jgi:hypothetical protein
VLLGWQRGTFFFKKLIFKRIRVPTSVAILLHFIFIAPLSPPLAFYPKTRQCQGLLPEREFPQKQLLCHAHLSATRYAGRGRERRKKPKHKPKMSFSLRDPGLTEYEREREALIARNRARMAGGCCTRCIQSTHSLKSAWFQPVKLSYGI